MAVCIPSLEDIFLFKIPPTEGEYRLLKFLSNALDDSYQVFFQPHLNGLQPDIVIVRQHHGVFIIEVKDYEIPLYEYESAKSWKVYDGIKKEQSIRSPFYQVLSYKDAMFQLFLRTANEALVLHSKNFAIISTAVFFSKAHDAQMKPLLDKQNRSEKWITCLTADDLDDCNRFTKKLPVYLREKTSSLFTDDIYQEIMRVLSPTERIRHLRSRQVIHYTKEQKNLIQSLPAHEIKVGGVAGSGKTLVLAQRAVHAYERTQSPILIVGFNITLNNYIHDYISRLRGTAPMRDFTIIHYHALRRYYDIQKKYKVILVDEVQDFEKEWIKDLRNNWLDKSDNDWEIVFFWDMAQDIYGRAGQGKKEKEPYTGIKGRSNQLKASFRLQSHIAEFSNAFQSRFFVNFKPEPIIPMNNIFDDSQISYYHTDSLDCEEIYNMYRMLVEVPSDASYLPNDNDIVFLGTRVAPVRLLDAFFRKKKYRTTTTFETQELYEQICSEYADTEISNQLKSLRRPRKFNFWPESGTIKLSTIHSFKGWEMETVFLLIDNTVSDSRGLYEADEEDTHITPYLLLTAFTRAIKNLIIIEIGDSVYTRFFQTYDGQGMKHLSHISIVQEGK